jgi:hypothetical protein
MMFTEEEARKKWCPLARSGDTRDEGRVSVNRCGNAADMDCFCIASACMAWREGVWPHQRNLAPEDRTPGVGYCGAFGVVGSPRGQS